MTTILDADVKSAILAYYGQSLAKNPELERTLKLAKQLRQQYRSGLLSVPKEIDLSGMDAETAEITAAFLLAVRG